MCVVSAVLDYGREIPPNQWTLPGWQSWKELLDAAQKADEKLHQPDCEDPEKGEWMEKMEKRMRKLEEEAGIDAIADHDEEKVLVFP